MDYKSHPSTPTPVVETPSSLPRTYGEDTLVLMTRDPWCAFAYWEVTDRTSAPIHGQIPAGSRIILRVYDVSGNLDVSEAKHKVDYPVGTLVGSWYLQLDTPLKSYVAELGYLTPDGRFYPLVRSGAVSFPRSDIADLYDMDWMVVEEEFARIYKVSGGGKLGPSSQEMAPVTEELRRLVARRMRAEAASAGMVGSAGPGSAGIP